nr:probable anion transporter 6, chloroplastic [Halyomorpha halys]
MEKERQEISDTFFLRTDLVEGWGARHSQVLLYFACITVTFVLRSNLSLAIVAMTTSITMNVPLSPAERALVLSSVFWGYGLLQTILGNLGRKTNSVRVLSYCILISAALTLATPLAAINFGAVGIIVVRVLMGIAQGGVYPNITNLLSMWAVPQEKAVLVPFVYNGSAFGTFVALITSGFIAERFDWPSIFYCSGILAVVIGGTLLYFGKCSPSDHKGISSEELEFMGNSFGDKRIETMKKLAVPWKKILTSAPVIVLTITHWTSNWGYWTINSLTPTYMNGVLHFEVASDGFLSALSPLTSLLLSFLFIIISMKTKNLMPPLYSKFIWNSIGMYGCALALTVLAYTEDTTLAIILITAGSGVSIAWSLGFQINHIDLSPNFAGILYSFTNTVANFASIFGPLISTYLLKDISDIYEWRIVFLLSAAILAVGNTCFLFWGTVKTQEWNQGKIKEAQVRKPIDILSRKTDKESLKVLLPTRVFSVASIEMEVPNKQPKWENGWGVRHTQIMLYFACISTLFMLRLNLTLAVVAMTTSTDKNVPLSSTERALVLSSLFWGYGLLQTFLGNLGRKTNAVRVLSYCMLISAILTLATPLAAIHFGAVGIIVVRALMGIAQGGVYPNINNLLSIWAVPQEKTVWGPFVYNGMAFGTFVAMIASGSIAARLGWPSIFYSSGIIGTAIGVALLYFGKCSPSEHQGISKEEEEFMRNSLGNHSSETMRKLGVPWKKILTSVPMITLTITHWCNSWGFWTINSLTPTYMNGVLHFEVERNGMLSALSPLTSLVLSVFSTIISIKTKNLIPPLFAKRMWTCVGMYGSASALIVLAYTQDTTIAIALITAGSGAAIACNLGFMTNHIDLSPNFAGILFSFTNSVANFASIFGPLISTYLLKDTSDVYEWRIVFLLSAGILIFGNTCFLIFGTTEKQEWDEGVIKKAEVE